MMDGQRTAGVPSLELAGIDGTNPLGFLAATGLLVVAHDSGASNARLRWKRGRTWIPVMDGLGGMDDDRPTWARIVASLRGNEVTLEAGQKYRKALKEFSSVKTAVKNERDSIKKKKLGKEERERAFQERVRPLEADLEAKRVMRLDALRAAVPRPELALGERIDCRADEFREHAETFVRTADATARDALRYLSAFGSDAVVKEGDGPRGEHEIEATPLCFISGSGGQNFLETVAKLCEKADVDRLRRTLFKPWTYRDEKLSMRWDPGEDKRYALLASNPSDDGALTEWMANLLAYRAMALLPCAPTRTGLGATGWARRDSEVVFSWPLWEFPAGPDLLRTMLQLRDLHSDEPNRESLRQRGVVAAYRARRFRFPPKGPSYKVNFGPARQLA